MRSESYLLVYLSRSEHDNKCIRFEVHDDWKNSIVSYKKKATRLVSDWTAVGYRIVAIALVEHNPAFEVSRIIMEES